MPDIWYEQLTFFISFMKTYPRAIFTSPFFAGVWWLKLFSTFKASSCFRTHTIPIAVIRTVLCYIVSVMLLRKKYFAAIATFYRCFSSTPVRMLSVFRMFFNMISPSNNNKVFNPIIIFNAVDVVNNFVRKQRSFKVFTHYFAMFRYVYSFFSCPFFFWDKKKNISTSISYNTTFPVNIFFFNCCHNQSPMFDGSITHYVIQHNKKMEVSLA
jgi:hypothetical protein